MERDDWEYDHEDTFPEWHDEYFGVYCESDEDCSDQYGFNMGRKVCADSWRGSKSDENEKWEWGTSCREEWICGQTLSNGDDLLWIDCDGDDKRRKMSAAKTILSLAASIVVLVYTI